MNIVDALVVTLGLDTRDFKRGSRDAREEDKKNRDAFGRSEREAEADRKKAAASIRSLRNETVGLVLAFAGASSVKSFLTGIVQNDAAVGRLAANIGLATENLSAWEGAVKRVGGQAVDADAALQAMATARQSYLLTGTTGHDADFQGLGVTLNDLQDPASALLKMAEAGERMSRPEFVARLQRIGIPEATINLLEKGRKGVEAMIVEQKRLGVVTDEDAKQAQILQDRLSQLESAITGKARPAITGLVGDLLDFTKQTDAATIAAPLLAGAVIAIGIAAIGIVGPLGAAAIALGGLGTAFEVLMDKYSKHATDYDDRRLATYLKNGDIKSAWRWSLHRIRKAHGMEDPPGSIPDAPEGMLPDWKSDNHLRNPQGLIDWLRGGAAASGTSVEDYLRGQGFTSEQARGIHAGIVAEGGTATAVNPKSGAFGIGQWLGPRKQALFAKYGPHPTLANQLDFLVWELKGGDPGGPRVGQNTTADNTLVSYIMSFMRPQGRNNEHMRDALADLSRGRDWLGGASAGITAQRGGSTTTSSVTIGQVTVYTPPGGNATTIARDLQGELRKRNLVVQHNSGLTG